MDPQADSDEEFIVLSTSDCTESASAPFPQAAGLKTSAELFAKSIGLLPSLLGARVTDFQASGTTRTYTRKYSETMGRQIADHRSVINYNYNIHGGRGGCGGEGGDQGGDGGTGQGPTVYFGQPEAREPSAFRTIQLGDLNLVKEFKEMRFSSQSSLVDCQSPRASVRRVYKAKLEGRESGHMTVAMYEGDGAEKAWKQHLANYESFRHPNVMQLYGLRIMKDVEFNEASDYMDDVSPKISRNSSVWIRSATGELCLDLAQGGPSMSSRFEQWRWTDRPRDAIRLENLSLDAPDSEGTLISSFSEEQYHELCSQPSIARFQYFQIPTEHPVGPGVFRLDSQYGTCVRITEPLQILPEKELHWTNYGDVPDELLPNSWIRYDPHWTNTLRLELQLLFREHGIPKAWLAQANCIFAELEEGAHIEDYICIHTVEFALQISDGHDIPEGFLFVCPPDDFRTSAEPHANLYQWPACPAYWSFDPSGADRLSTEDARILGFPTIHIETIVDGCSWDRSVYEGLRRFHEGKGFDPNSREVAKQLEYPLFEVLSDLSSEVPLPVHRAKGVWCDREDPALCRELRHYL
ncbi:hypothetical protein MSAN_02281500 [Mycena sanguinolenta]|uniref:Uncharacterized protein n=1 Tax=Mycena sanguinolenta TaxID=230812 RepID=A0A8H6XAQ0_9AGAR|nr:hypothetical protein MSAN_02281500 [Mycena sanguinolenta]